MAKAAWPPPPKKRSSGRALITLPRIARATAALTALALIRSDIALKRAYTALLRTLNSTNILRWPPLLYR